MTCNTLPRVASAPDAQVSDLAAPGGPPRPRWRRLLAGWAPRPATEASRLARLEELLTVLDTARAELERGWVQGGWWAVPGNGGPALLTGFAAAAADPKQVNGVCLVGALLRGGSRRLPHSGSEVGRAVDAVYDAVWESRGHAAVTPYTGLEPVSAPPVRLARVQTLTRWNDAAGRTRAEVLAVVDSAIARTILSLATVPSGAAAG